MAGKIAISLAALASVAAAVQPVSVKGSKFVSADGKPFEIVGVAYQPGGSAGFNPASGIDPLSDSKACLRDASIMQKLGVNAVRVYNLDPNVSHDECAGIFDAAGIHMIIDVNSPLPGQSINAAEPWTTYTADYLQRVFQVIEAFKGYPNLLGFFAGNEIINDVNSGKIDPPYIRAVTRDMKNYIAKNSPGRAIPVGYSAADVREILFDTSSYLQCTMDNDSNDMSKIDFFGLNSYSWCGASDMQKAGYDQLVTGFNSTTIPIFFSEYGCNAVTPRPFTEVQAIYGPSMNHVFSGAIAYEWTQEANNYGLVQIASDASAKLMPDFDNLQKQLSQAKTSQSMSSNSTTAPQQAPKCDASLIKNAGFNNNFTLPAVPAGAQAMIDNGVKSGFQGGKAVKLPTDTKCPVPVTASNGQAISGLSINVVPCNSTSVGGYNGTSLAKGATFTQLNGTTNGTATMQTVPVATATPPAPPQQSQAAASSAVGAPAINTPAANIPASTQSSSPALPSSNAASLTHIAPISLVAAVMGLLVL